MRQPNRFAHGAVLATALFCILTGVVSPAAGQDGIHGLVSNFDGSFETAIPVVGGPGAEYGAFAEQMAVAGNISEIEIVLMRAGPGPGFPFDVTVETYVWTDHGGRPGALLAELAQDVTGFVPDYPGTIRLSFPLVVAGVSRPWVGTRLTPVSPGVPIGLAADTDGGAYVAALTNVAPGTGFPTGWQEVGLVFPPIRSLGISARMTEIEFAGDLLEYVGASNDAPVAVTGCWDFERFQPGDFDAPGCAFDWPDTFGSAVDFEGWAASEGADVGYGVGPFLNEDGTTAGGNDSDVEGQVLWFFDPATGGFPPGHVSAFNLPMIDDDLLGLAHNFSALRFLANTESDAPPQTTELEWVVGSRARLAGGDFGPWQDLTFPVRLGPRAYLVPVLAQGPVRQLRIGVKNPGEIFVPGKGAAADKVKEAKKTFGPQTGYKPVPVINQGKIDVSCQAAAAAQCLAYWAANGYPEILPEGDNLKDKQNKLAKELAKEIEPSKDNGADGKKGRGWGGIEEVLKGKGIYSPQVPPGGPPPRRSLKSLDIPTDKGAPYDSIKAHLARSHDVILDFKAYKNGPNGPVEVKNSEGKPIAHAVTAAQVIEENGKKIIKVADPNGSSAPEIEDINKAGKHYKGAEVTDEGPPMRFKCKEMEFDGVDFYELTSIHIVRPDPANPASKQLPRLVVEASSAKGAIDSLVTYGYAIGVDNPHPLSYFAIELEVPYSDVHAPAGWTWEPLPSIPPAYATCENAFGPAGIAWRTESNPVPPGGSLSGFTFTTNRRFPVSDEAVDWYLASTDDGGEYGFAGGPGPVQGTSAAPGPVNGPARDDVLEVAVLPNPSEGRVEIRFSTQHEGSALLTVFDVLGRRVGGQSVVRLGAGSHSLAWDPTDTHGRRLPPGVYMYQLEAAGARGQGRFVLRN